MGSYMGKPEELLKSWLRLCHDPRTTADLLEKAAYWESINRPKEYAIRLAVAKHRSTSSDVLAKLSMIKQLPIQIAVAAHGNLSEATAMKILKLQVRELRRALAGNPKIPIFVMKKLAHDFTDVRIRLARNPAIPLVIMKRFAGETDEKIRIALCQNRRLHTSILERLSRDKVAEIRIAVVEHPDMPAAGLKQMAEDPSEQVRAAVFAKAMTDYSDDQAIFKALAKFKNTEIGQDAKKHIDFLILKENSVSEFDD